MTFAGFEYLAFGPVAGAPTSLVVLLHGYGRNAHYMEKMAHAVQQAVPQALVLCPHGPEALDTKEMEGSRDGHFLHVPQDVATTAPVPHGLFRQWFRIDGALPDLIPRLRVAAGQLNDFIDAQRDRLGLADRNIVIMGFSQGAGLALYTAFSRAADIGGMVCHSAIAIQLAGGDPHLVSRPRTFYIYGTEDGEFKQERYAASFDWLQAYTGGKASCQKITGLGHSTNAESRHACAIFIKNALA